MYAWRNADRKNPQLVDWTGIGPNGWHTSNFFSQPLLEPELDGLARQYPNASVQRGWELVAVEDEPDQPPTVVVEGRDGFTRTGQRRTLTARYVIGADGATASSAARWARRCTTSDSSDRRRGGCRDDPVRRHGRHRRFRRHRVP